MPLGKRTDCGDAKYAGVSVPFPAHNSVDCVLQECLDTGFDFVAAPLRRAVQHNSVPLSHKTALLVPTSVSTQVVGIVDPTLDADSSEPAIKQHSIVAIKQELDWAGHLGLQACIVSLKADNVSLAHILNQVLAAGTSNMAIWLHVPLAVSSNSSKPHSLPSGSSHSTASSTTPNSQQQPDSSDRYPSNHQQQPHLATDSHTETICQDPWQWWNRVRSLCSHSSKLGLILEIPSSMPSQDCLDRWVGEPVRAVMLSTKVFQSNKRGYPALPRGHQAALAMFFKLNVQVLLSDADSLLRLEAYNAAEAQASASQPSTSQNGHGGQEQHPLSLYHEYLSFLFRRQPEAKPEQMLELSYRDYLQAPLQPLQDNLESQTYETFEKDQTKYDTYEAAIHAALLDQPEKVDDQAVVIMVVGAGRGPLITASLQAADKARRKVTVWAVEKNPNAIVHIQHLVASSGWEDLVTVVSADMRHWKAPQTADMLVSELLGSFGDNELSPECLDGAQRFLREGGVSIPTSYTSFLQPITTSKLWNDVKAYDDVKQFETPFVAKLHRFTPLAAPQPVFIFSHPNSSKVINNDRQCHLQFEGFPQAAICHGFAGYFDSKLYGDVHLSILPSTHTPGMFSWFPIYFPLQQPVQLLAQQGLDMCIWRCSGNYKVWYEWCVTRPQTSKIHNVNGKSYFVGL